MCSPYANSGDEASDSRSATPSTHRPRITLKHGSASERATQRQLEQLLDRYDLSPWFFTDAVQIDEDPIPHSHPVLTLHTRHLRDDLLLLGTYVHEQAHWYFDRKEKETQRAMSELESVFPDVPSGFPDGARDKESSYLHLCVIPFEYHGLRTLVGELQARQVMEFWADDHYRVLYRTVLDSGGKIWPILKKNGLEPPMVQL